MSEQVAQTIE